MRITMNNYKLILQYDGTRYSGWQKQGNTDNTIQAKLETIAGKLTGTPTDVNGSGRTDAGVHALGQTANFRCEKKLADTDYIRDYFNHALPMDIRVISVEEAPTRFHARLNAKEKHYRYVIDNAIVPNVFERRYAARIPSGHEARIPYDIKEMKKAAAYLTGEHDFKSFCDNRHMKKSTVRTIRDIRIVRTKLSCKSRDDKQDQNQYCEKYQLCPDMIFPNLLFAVCHFLVYITHALSPPNLT